MASKETLACMAELYQGEMLGEIFFEALIGDYDDPIARRMLLAALQGEAEAKVRLRPAMEQLGVPIEMAPETRARGDAAAADSKGLSWSELAARTHAAVRDHFVPRYEHVAEIAAADGDPLAIEVAGHMIKHGRALAEMFALHLAGDPDPTRPVDALLHYPMGARAPA